MLSPPTAASVDERLLRKTSTGNWIQLPLDYFLIHVLPPLHPHLDVNRIVENLKSSGKKSRRAITARNRWRGFAQDPAESPRPESRSFEYLTDVVQAITKATRKVNCDSAVYLQTNPNGGLSSYDRTEDSFPDAYMRLRCSSGSALGWMDIAASGEFEKGCSASDRETNANKILWSMCNTLRRDPRRRFTYGFTIENTSMRLWYCDRYRIIASDPFNFIFEHKPVVHFFSSISYARSDELGWDPTVRLLKDDQQTPQYDITVRTEDGEKLVYRTLELISDLAVESAIGKGTRVWKVIRLRNGEPFGEPAVLKDSWVDKDRPREGTICQELRSFAGPVEPPPGLADALLTVECYGDVFIEPGPDLIYLDHTIQLPTTQPPNCGISPPPVWSVGRYKIHHRIVFKEICTPMMNSSAFQNVFRVLGQACLALQALHTAGWVHRDISSANILIDNTGRAKLIDLEYAKKVDEECAKEMRVGTAKFMAAELILRRYQYRRMRTPELMAHLPPKRNREEDYRLLFDTQSLPPIESPPPAPRLPSPKPKPPFRYNAIHDFESLWWLTTYYVFKMEAVVDRTSTSLPKPQLKNLEQQRAHADKLSYDRSWRDVVMLNTDAFIESVHALDPSVRPFGMIMEQWRKKILRAYYQAEETLIPDAKSAMQGLYSEFAKDLVWISDALASKTVMIEETWTNEEPVVVTVAKETSKRKREDDEDKSEQKAEEPADSPRSRKRARNTCPPHMVDGPAARTRARLKAKAR